VVTNLIQADALLPTELAKPGSPAAASGTGQGSFATALQSAVNSNSAAKTNSSAKPETQPKFPEGEKEAQSLQPFLTPLAVPLAPAPLPAANVEGSIPPFSPLPGKIGSRDVSQPEGDEPSTTSDTRHQPSTLPLSFPERIPGTPDAPSANPPGLAVPVPPGISAAAAEGFTNPADPLMQLTPAVASAQAGGVAAANTTADSSMIEPTSKMEPESVGDLVPSGPTPGVPALVTTASKAVSGGQLDPVEVPEQAAATVLQPDYGMATAATGLQPGASLLIVSKPLRILDTEARKLGSLPLRDLIANAPVWPQASKMISPPAQPKTGAASFTPPVLNSAKGSQGSQLSQSPNTAASPDAAVKGKTLAPDTPDPATPPAISPDSNALPLQIDTQPENLPTASAVGVIATSTSQNPSSQTLATNPTDAPGQYPIQTSSDVTTGGAVLVPAARVVQGVAQSEMHIGFRSPAFGSVEVHTAVRDTQLGLAVSSEKGDLRGFLAQEVPALQTVFHQQGLQFDQIRFMTPGSGTGSGFSAGSESNSNSPGNERTPRSWFSQDAPEPDMAASEIQIRTTRLSVHA
jgi:hypothetical protein